MKRIMMHCASTVDKKYIRREIVDGVERIVINSFTLPDGIVMNGITYPKNEVDKSYKTLEGSLAPIEHPIDKTGNYIPANSSYSIDNFYAGASNANVKKVNGRVSMDKIINVPEALKTDRGKRLLDRVNELETSKSPRPIHTSVGVYLSIEERGSELFAKDLVFDHDAILLDSVGAATPSDGVGMAVNADGEKLEIQNFTITNNTEDKGNDMKDLIINALKEAKIETDGLSEKDLLAKFTQMTANQKKEPNPEDKKKLEAAEADKKKAEAEAEANKKAEAEGAEGSEDSTITANELTAMSKRLDDLQGAITANEDKEKAKNIEIIVNSKKYQGMTAEMMAGMTTDALKTLAANCVESFGVAPHFSSNSDFEPTTMAEE